MGAAITIVLKQILIKEIRWIGSDSSGQGPVAGCHTHKVNGQVS